MTIKEACKLAGIDISELLEETEQYFNAKISKPGYEEYHKNEKAKDLLYNDCLQETLLSKLSLKGKLNLAFGGSK